MIIFSQHTDGKTYTEICQVYSKTLLNGKCLKKTEFLTIFGMKFKNRQKLLKIKMT